MGTQEFEAMLTEIQVARGPPKVQVASEVRTVFLGTNRYVPNKELQNMRSKN